MKTKIALGLLLFVGMLQLVPTELANPPVTAEVPAGDAVRALLRRACYDCHSNESRWPWYAHVAPVSWLIEHDVNEAREHVNFSTWDEYTPEQRAHKLEEVWEEVQEGEMPLWFYIPLHPQARLSVEDMSLLRDWSGASEE